MSERNHEKGEVSKTYFDLFVNRRAYTLQTSPERNNEGKTHYYRPKKDAYLSIEIIRRHLQGQITIGLYPINPITQRCKWIALDADYEEAFRDLLKLQWELRNDGIDSALERSRRGGHLWIFAQETLLAAECRRYVQSLAARVSAPLGELSQQRDLTKKQARDIEIFPKQDRLSAGEFGNAIRGPLGIHRRDGKRYWFYGADYRVEAQLEYLSALGKLSQEKLSRLLTGLPTYEEPRTTYKKSRSFGPPMPLRMSNGSFSILTYLGGRLRKLGRNYFTRCPSCARHGRDRHGDNLAIAVREPAKYRCWAGCTKEEIRAALGLRCR